MDDMKFVKPLILAMVFVVLICLGAAFSHENDGHHKEKKAKAQSESTYDEETTDDAKTKGGADAAKDKDEEYEPIEVDENGVPTEKGYQQILEREREDALDKSQEALLDDAKKAAEDEYWKELAESINDDYPAIGRDKF